MSKTENARRPRADAARNREKLLDAASAVVAETGELSLAAVAARAGVGIGTLYRHFPNRDALLAALYRNEVDRLHHAAVRLAKELPPFEALEKWLGGYATLMQMKYGMADAMRSAINSDAEIFTHSRVRLIGALSSLLKAAAAAGSIRGDADPDDVLLAVSASVSASRGRDDAVRKTERLLALVIDGLRYGAGKGIRADVAVPG
ncbi:TetR/AcrR family transcriptional regulator [Mesorhizobium sp. BAC0120]|uniref:TetR/AcrR family transcriptional regulator n=1 Tax=Mesorhizobium sp. BAC0120 TaxID=3090670 RepID=UPI00298C91B5|nr:TetR/AcrR family transcriptional regulator [Mesorhizobium sp. BAC0120]MDW6020824.1 TetR/AcrR family transcriptional regulator [Mesorhizobium sp. BAC0120]